jgi:rhodanese-related sulfurtransferase
MKKSFILIFISMFISSAAFSYDQGLAKSYDQYFSPFSGETTGNALQMIPTKAFIESLKYDEELFVVDIRTPGETGVYGFNFKNSITIPMNDVFKPKNLAKIPTTGKVVIVCKAGHRAMAIATGLRHIGFKNVFVLKSGISDIAQYLTPKSAY